MEQMPIKTRGGTVRINDSRLFPINTTTAAALVEVNPGGMRELHWHPNGDEWLYVIEGQARMGVRSGRDGPLPREYRQWPISVSRNVQEPLLRRRFSRHMDGVDSAGTRGCAS